MSTPIEVYLGKISQALSEYVLPQVEHGHAKSQLEVAIDLLNRLKVKCDYKVEFYETDYQWSREIFQIIETRLRPLGIDLDAELKITRPLTELSHDCMATAVVQNAPAMTAAASKALDLLYREKNRIDDFSDLEDEIYRIILRWAMRSLNKQS